jgi:hypothetical protein
MDPPPLPPIVRPSVGGGVHDWAEIVPAKMRPFFHQKLLISSVFEHFLFELKDVAFYIKILKSVKIIKNY